MIHVNVYEAKSQLSRLRARVEAGEEIVITSQQRSTLASASCLYQ